MSITVAHSFPVWLPQTQTWLYNQVRFLPDPVDAHVICKETQNLQQFDLPGIHALSGPSSRISALTTRLFRHLDYHWYVIRQCRSIRPDVLHSHFGPVGWKNHRMLQLFRPHSLQNMKHVVTFYGQDVDHLPKVNPSWKRRYRDMFRKLDLVLCEGSFMAEKVAQLGCPEERIRIQHLGVDLDQIAFHPRVMKPGEPFRILMAAAFRPKKGFLYGMKALDRLASKYDIRLTLVGDTTGDPDSNREKERIMQFLSSVQWKEKVTLRGFLTRDELRNTALEHHIYLAPSVTAEDGDSEGGAPVSLIEMAAGGMPVISTRHCDIPEVIRHGKSGLLANEGDVEGLAAHLDTLLSDPESWPGFAREARKHIEEHYDARKQGKRLMEKYTEVRKQNTESRIQKAEDRKQKTEYRIQGTENRKQKTEDREEIAGDSKQGSENRDQWIASQQHVLRDTGGQHRTRHKRGRSRLLVVSHSCELYGAERSLFTALQGLKETGRYEILVLVPGEGTLTERLRSAGMDYRIASVPRWIGKRYHFITRYYRRVLAGLQMPALVRIALQWRPDLVYTNTLATPAGSLLKKHLPWNPPHIWHARELPGHPDFGYFDWGERNAFKHIAQNSDRLISNSRFLANELGSALAPYISQRNIDIIYNGFDLPKSSFRTKDIESCQSGSRPEDSTGEKKRRMIMAGSITPLKNHGDAIEALRILTDEGFDFRLDIYGNGPAAWIRKLKKQIMAANLKKRITWRGYDPDIASRYTEADMLLITSRMESFGRVAVEAMLAGCPVISSDAGGLPEVVVDGETGLLYRAGCPDHLAERIRLLNSDPDLKYSLSDEAVKRVIEKFGRNNYIAAIDRLLQEEMSNIQPMEP